jgi:hypothetical protein
VTREFHINFAVKAVKMAAVANRTHLLQASVREITTTTTKKSCYYHKSIIIMTLVVKVQRLINIIIFINIISVVRR